jgi:hypothetical protein
MSDRLASNTVFGFVGIRNGRDHVPTEVRAVRPSAADWATLQLVLDHTIAAHTD